MPTLKLCPAPAALDSDSFTLMLSAPMPPFEIQPLVIACDTTHCQVRHKNLYVTYAYAGADARRMELLVRNLDAFLSHARDKAGFVLITEGGSRPPDLEQRRLLTSTLSRHAHKLGGIAVCIGAEGFIGSAIRSVASAIFLLPSRGYPVRFFARDEDPCAWLAPLLHMPVQDVEGVIKFAISQVAVPLSSRRAAAQ